MVVGQYGLCGRLVQYHVAKVCSGDKEHVQTLPPGEGVRSVMERLSKEHPVILFVQVKLSMFRARINPYLINHTHF